MKEIWKDVVGYEGIYQVINKGRVKRLEYRSFRRDGSSRILKQKILKGKGEKRPHKRVSLWKDHNSRDYYVHRLVANAFIPKIEGKSYINHKDGNPRNNEIENLEWCTIAENNLHACRTGLRNNSYKVKLTRINDGESFEFPNQREASNFIGRAQAYVGRHLRNDTYPKDINGNYYLAERV